MHILVVFSGLSLARRVRELLSLCVAMLSSRERARWWRRAAAERRSTKKKKDGKGGERDSEMVGASTKKRCEACVAPKKNDTTA